jgi:hypothetical protein
LGKAVKEHFIKPFADGVQEQKKMTNLLIQKRAIDAAEEFGDGTGTGATKQYDIVDQKLSGS